MSDLKILLLAVFCFLSPFTHGQLPAFENHNPYAEFQIINQVIALQTADKKEMKEVLKHLDEHWKEGYTPMLLDVLYMAGRKFDGKPILQLLRKKRIKTLVVMFYYG